jgi:predicted ATPase
MKRFISEADVEREVAAAYTFFREQGSAMPPTFIEDYRRVMRCPDVEALAAYAEDALPLEQALSIAAHESQCPVCRADVAELRGYVRQQVSQLLAAMPLWASPFVGREELRESLGETLSSGNRQLLTLTAPSGTGKTRLTLETAVERSYLFSDGVWFAPIAGASDVATAAAEIARAVQLRLEPKDPPIEQLRDFFADKRALLVLDDVPAQSPAAQVAIELIRQTPDLCCLTTTISPFGVRGEHAVQLPPLQHRFPNFPISQFPDVESLQLFAAHVQVVQPGYRFDEPDLRSAAALCQRAAGMPLGIELAAARVREMSPGEMLRRMEERGAPPDDPVASLDEMMAWSYDLLSQRERNLLHQLSVFVGGFTAEQAAAVCEDDGLPLIESLEQKALLQRTETLGRARFQLLAPIRDFARQRLGERYEAMRRRHSAYFFRYAQHRDDLLSGRQQVDAMEEMSADLLNLRAGMDWAERCGDWRTAGGYGRAMSQFLIRHGLWTECSYRLRVASSSFHRAQDTTGHQDAQLELARCLTFKGEYNEAEAIFNAVAAEATQRGETARLAEATHGLGNVAQFRGQYAQATQRFEEVLKHFETTGDRWRVADCYHNLGWLAWRQGNYERAESLLKNSLEIQRERGDRYRLGATLAVLGNIAFEQGRWDEARQWFEESLQARQELGDARGIASAVTNVGMVWQALGDPARAAYCFAEAARRLERLGDRRTLGQVLMTQGNLALAQGDLAAAREHFEKGVKMFETVGNAHDSAQALGELGRVAQREGRREEASQLYRDSLTRLRAIGDRVSVAIALYRWGQLLSEGGDAERAALMLNVALNICTEGHRQERADVEAALRQLEDRLGAEQATTWRQQANALTLDEVVSLALRQ